jgi:secreted trypsin-like serine protease
MKGTLIFFFFFSCFNSADAQLWGKSEPKSYHASIVKVVSGNVSGSGSVVFFIGDSEEYPEYYIGLVLTAAHVIQEKGRLYEIRFNSGKRTVKNTAVLKNAYQKDKFNDVALIRALIPDEVIPIKMSSLKPKPGDKLEIGGWGAGELRTWTATCGGTSIYSDGIIVFSWAIQGDSGGPILLNGRVIGVVCRGHAIAVYKDTRRLIVGPIYGSSVNRLKSFLAPTAKNEKIKL